MQARTNPGSKPVADNVRSTGPIQEPDKLEVNQEVVNLINPGPHEQQVMTRHECRSHTVPTISHT